MSSFLVKQIRFQSLLSSVDDDELGQWLGDEYKLSGVGKELYSAFAQVLALSKEQFIKSLCADSGSCSVGVMLFNHFQFRSSQNLHRANQELDDLMEKISEIINIETGGVPMDLPYPIIGQIASYLEQNDYFHFEQTNRAMFIGCNSPNMLKKLDLTRIKFKAKKYDKLNIEIDKIKLRYSKLRLLENDQERSEALNFWDHPQYSWILRAKPYHALLDEKMHRDIERLKSDWPINYAEYEKMNLEKYESLQMIKIEIFKLKAIILPNKFSVNKRKAIELPKKKNIFLLVDYISNFLDAYYCRDNDERSVRIVLLDPSISADFDPQSVIILQDNEISTVADVLKSANNLKGIILKPYKNGKSSLSERDLRSAVMKIIWCASIEYFEIDLNNTNFEIFFKIVNIALDYKSIERDRLKIKINIDNSIKTLRDIDGATRAKIDDTPCTNAENVTILISSSQITTKRYYND